MVTIGNESMWVGVGWSCRKLVEISEGWGWNETAFLLLQKKKKKGGRGDSWHAVVVYYFTALQKLPELILKLTAAFWPYAACFQALRWRSIDAFETSFLKEVQCCVGVWICCQHFDFYYLPSSHWSCSLLLVCCDLPGRLYVSRRCVGVSFKCFLPRWTIFGIFVQNSAGISVFIHISERQSTFSLSL